jgi:hypothetical protein
MHPKQKWFTEVKLNDVEEIKKYIEKKLED